MFIVGSAATSLACTVGPVIRPGPTGVDPVNPVNPINPVDPINPIIEGTGIVEFPPDHFCTWNTNNGSTCICNITNPGAANNLLLIIAGAPDTLLTTTGEPFNGEHTLGPNSPTNALIAYGDFLGRQVTIFNASTPSATARVATQCPENAPTKGE